jgi:hypothetical protein
MEDYKQRAQQKYLEKRKIIIEEEMLIQKKIGEERIRKEEELRKIQEKELQKQQYIESQITIIDESIMTFQYDNTDDNIMLIITNIISSLDCIMELVDNIQKQYIIDKIVDFTNQVDSMNTTRPKSINTIANVKILSNAFIKIYEKLGLDVEIITMDTEEDANIARNLARPTHLAGAAIAAIERAKKNKICKD